MDPDAVIYLTHPEVVIDPAVPVPDWGLSPLGAARVADAAARMPAQACHVVSSAERKALETAWPFGARVGRAVAVCPGLHENDRSATGYLAPERFEQARVAFFSSPDRSYSGWETARHAQARIMVEVSVVLDALTKEPVLFCGHGGVGALLMSGLAGTGITLEDDRGGNGHWFAFRRGTGEILSDWRPIEVLFL